MVYFNLKIDRIAWCLLNFNKKGSVLPPFTLLITYSIAESKAVGCFLPFTQRNRVDTCS